MLQQSLCLAVLLGCPFLLSCSVRAGQRDDADGGAVVRKKPDGGTPQPLCRDLKCRVPNCSGKGAGTTSISGVVNIPAGNLPLYNATVYIPNGPLSPIPTGPSCDRCDNKLSGDPLVMTTTDVFGWFQLKNVPAGQDIPLVVSLGKWRRQVTLPKVTPCTDTALDPDLTRLPRTQDEGNIPRIGLSTGFADAVECLLRKIGLADSEFTTEAGFGRINLFAGSGGTDRYSAALNGGAALSASSAWWENVDNLKKYDLVLLSCEGQQYLDQKSMAARQAMVDFINAGGRVFASHWHNGWIQAGPPPINQVATFYDQLGSAGLPAIDASIDTSFDKGHVLAEWLLNVGASTDLGTLHILQARNTVQSIDASLAQRYVYYTNPQHGTPDPQYFTFNAPIGAPAAEQCGRMVFTDMHVSGNDPTNLDPALDSSGPQVPFPQGCVTKDLSPQEKALIFLLFDLTNCVQPVIG